MKSRLFLVDREHPLPEGWEEQLDLVIFRNSLGDEIRIDQETFDAYERLRASLAREGVLVDVDSAYRSVAEQRALRERFLKKYGEAYTEAFVGLPGTSEHHTGMAVDLFLIVEGRAVVLNEELVLFTDLWKRIHSQLPDFGFILRYPEGKESITNTGYEPWHIRYVGEKAAREMSSKGLTMEEYLKAM